jgi:hypothetical protein
MKKSTRLKKYRVTVRYRFEGYRSDHEETCWYDVEAQNEKSALKKGEARAKDYPSFERIIWSKVEPEALTIFDIWSPYNKA